MPIGEAPADLPRLDLPDCTLIPGLIDAHVHYSPLGVGFLSGKYSKSWTAPAGTRFDIMPDHRAIYENATSMARMEKLRAKAAESGRLMV